MEQQQQLFTGAPTPQQPPNPLDARNEAREAAYAAADEQWREEYTRHILQYLASHDDGTAEDIREAYTGPQTPNSQRASGQIFLKLRRAGRIRMVGSRKSRLYGNLITIYRLVV